MTTKQRLEAFEDFRSWWLAIRRARRESQNAPLRWYFMELWQDELLRW